MSEPTYNIRVKGQQRDSLTVIQIQALWVAGELPEDTEIWQAWVPEDLRWVPLVGAMELPPRAPEPPPAHLGATSSPPPPAVDSGGYNAKISARLREGWMLITERPDGAQLRRKRPRKAGGPFLVALVGLLAGGAVRDHQEHPLAWLLGAITLTALIVGVMRLLKPAEELVWVPRG